MRGIQLVFDASCWRSRFDHGYLQVLARRLVVHRWVERGVVRELVVHFVHGVLSRVHKFYRNLHGGVLVLLRFRVRMHVQHPEPSPFSREADWRSSGKSLSTGSVSEQSIGRSDALEAMESPSPTSV